jgi:cystathionine beta-lyase family protein involved in aluminum resistance
MPGYDRKVNLAAVAFTLGASIDLSAAAFARTICAWMQGGLNYHSAKTGVLLAAQSMLEKG